MKNVTSLKSNTINSPKTPGGISKSLLTPCRRVGLSRSWKKSGPSPFISPLSNSNIDVKEEKTEERPSNRKRKDRENDESVEEIETTSCANVNTVNSDDIETTPSRTVDVPRRKKSKTRISTLNNSHEDITELEQNKNLPEQESVKESRNKRSSNNENIEVVSTPVRTKSKKSKKLISPLKTSPKEEEQHGISDHKQKPLESSVNIPIKQKKEDETVYTIKEKSPNDLRKECIVVIQRKIFKNVTSNDNIDSEKPKSNDQVLADSDSDDVTLIDLHNKQNSMIKTEKQHSSTNEAILEDDDNDFIDNKTIKVKPNRLNSKSEKNKPKTIKPVIKVEKIEQKQASQNSFDEDDDDFDNKKTILIKKTYEKISKPVKAKSTGSITQKDIDNLRRRIEAKKKLLLAQSLTPDTEELRSLIKKWQKGCQDALMELLDLMRNKFPDKETMDYSEMLKALKIPPSLVGYDSDNDCFNSPDDVSIILGQYKDL